MRAFKPLLPWPPGNEFFLTVIETVIQNCLSAGIRSIVLVAGQRFDDIRRILNFYPVEIVRNDAPDTGMSQSISIAVRHCSTESSFLIYPGDHPAVRASTIETLLQMHISEPRRIIIPVFDGRRGHPTIIPKEFRDELLNPDPNQGLRGIFRKNPDYVREWICKDRGILINLDRPEDYQGYIEECPDPS